MNLRIQDRLISNVLIVVGGLSRSSNAMVDASLSAVNLHLVLRLILVCLYLLSINIDQRK